MNMDNQLFLLLVTRKLSGEATKSDLQQLEKLFEEDEYYQQKFDLFKAHWESKNNIGTDTGLAFQKIMHEINASSNRSSQPEEQEKVNKKDDVLRMVKRLSRVAAILIVSIGSIYLIYRNTRPLPSKTIAQNAWLTKQNPRGTKSVITLSDSTKVILNADSKLRFPTVFTGSTREVYLTGEAFFDVTHNAKVPFIIHTSKMNIKVLGTEFNVKSYPEDSTSETTLIRGLIEVTLNDRPSDKIILRPKEKLIVSNEPSSKSVSSRASSSAIQETRLLISSLHYISPKDSAIVETSWLDNKLVFQDESFAQLTTDLERRYGVAIRFSNTSIRDLKFTGVFEKETIDEVLKALQLTEKFNYKTEGNNITIF